MRRPEKIRLKDGRTRWQLRFEDAHRRMRYKRFATRADAEAFAKTLDAARAAGIDPARRVRFHELAEEWRASHLAHGLRPSAVKDYKQSLQRLCASLGQRELRGITAADLERLRNELVLKVRAERTARLERMLARIHAKPERKRTQHDRSHLSREPELRAGIERGGIRAAAKVIGTARTLWRFAVARGYAARNVAQDVRKPKSDRPVANGVIDANILTPAEIEQLIAAAPESERCVMRFLFMTGVRFGELTGLMWTDFELDRSRVIVRRQRSGLTGELTAPKTAAGTRWIDLPAELVRALKRHKAATGGEFAFPLDERNWRSRVWHPALRRAGLRAIRIHDARHTHASLLIAAGADVVAVSRRLGHANPSITLSTYSHAFARRDAAPLGEQLAAFMRREAGGCVLVVPRPEPLKGSSEPVDLMVARDRIELPTRGFSVRMSFCDDYSPDCPIPPF